MFAFSVNSLRSNESVRTRRIESRYFDSHLLVWSSQVINRGITSPTICTEVTLGPL